MDRGSCRWSIGNLDCGEMSFRKSKVFDEKKGTRDFKSMASRY
jgi:hypothetical protein